MTKDEWLTQMQDDTAPDRLVQARWDDFLRRRPICADCGEHIAAAHCLVLDDGACLCPRCVRERMRPTEDCA